MKQNQLLILVGLVAILVLGSAIYSQQQQASRGNNMMDMMNHGSTQSHRSYRIEAQDRDYKPNASGTFTFSIRDDRNQLVKDFAISHEKKMHLIVIRKDLQQFQHLHPEYNQRTGVFTQSNLTFPTDGPFRLFADFVPANSQKDAHGEPLPVTVYKDIEVGTIAAYTPESIGLEQAEQTLSNYTVKLVSQPTSPPAGQDTILTFTVTQGDKPVANLEPYLGALGHVVILNRDTLEYLHTHPKTITANADGTVAFSVDFPEAGIYKAFGQFQHQGEVLTGSWVLPQVQPATSNSSSHMDDMMDMMNGEGDGHGH